MSIEDDITDITEWYTKFFTDNQTTLNPFNQYLLDELINCKCFNFNPMAITIQNYLTDKQLDFLMSNTLSIFDKESATYTFIREIFKADEKNIPIDDSIFLCSIFEMINLYLYLVQVDKIVPTLNKSFNINKIDCFSSKHCLKAGIQTVRLEFNLFNDAFTYTRSYDKEAISLFNKVVYKVDNLNEFLFKICTIYDEFIDLMPQEELDL